MYEWAAARNDLILIAGHTHNPVFVSIPDLATLERVQGDLYKKPDDDDAAGQLDRDIDSARSEASGDNRSQGARGRSCYFNSGCCCFSNGDITGIELADGGSASSSGPPIPWTRHCASSRADRSRRFFPIWNRRDDPEFLHQLHAASLVIDTHVRPSLETSLFSRDSTRNTAAAVRRTPSPCASIFPRPRSAALMPSCPRFISPNADCSTTAQP